MYLIIAKELQMSAERIRTLDNYRFEMTSISSLKPFPRNSRKHSEKQIQQVINSINQFGFTNPILMDENSTIIAGHCRLLAAKKVGLEVIPCIILSGLTETQKHALVIADNKIALNAEWDIDVLLNEVKLLQDDNFDIELTGFTLDEIADLTPDCVSVGLCEDDDVPSVQDDPITKLGDIYTLGNHRLMCGDSTMIDSVEKLMNGEKADMVFTDPPYGVNFEQGKFIGRDKQGKNRNFDPILNDDKQGDDLKELLIECFSNLLSVINVCSIYVWSPHLKESFSVLNALIESGWHIQSQLIWNKTPFVIGRADYHWKHEVCWYGYIGEKHQWHGGRDKSTVWECPKVQSSDLHPTMKPVQLAENACLNSTKSGDKVLDIFGGSGSTLIACEKTNRKCYMMELSPNYCDVIVKRWEQFTGKKAVLNNA